MPQMGWSRIDVQRLGIGRSKCGKSVFSQVGRAQNPGFGSSLYTIVYIYISIYLYLYLFLYLYIEDYHKIHGESLSTSPASTMAARQTLLGAGLGPNVV